MIWSDMIWSSEQNEGAFGCSDHGSIAELWRESTYPASTTSRPLGEMEAAVYSSLMSKVTSFSKVGDWKGVAGPAISAVGAVAVADKTGHVKEQCPGPGSGAQGRQGRRARRAAEGGRQALEGACCKESRQGWLIPDNTRGVAQGSLVLHIACCSSTPRRLHPPAPPHQDVSYRAPLHVVPADKSTVAGQSKSGAMSLVDALVDE